MSSYFKTVKLLAFCGMLLGLCGCLSESVPEGMVLVPAGSFRMGSDEADKDNQALALGLQKPWFTDESPQHDVYLPDYFIDKYEVTNRQYYIFCQATDHPPPPGWNGMKYPPGTDDLPVTSINFYSAAAYAEWAGKRLPSEAEWEKAARGPDNFIYPWGNEFEPTSANVSLSTKSIGLRPVGSFPQGISFYGTHDMIGNVWEWVWDYYAPYPGSNHKSPDYDKKYVIVRGMSYLGVGHFAKTDYQKIIALMSRASYREKLNPLSGKKDVGFRCVKEAKSMFQQFIDKENKPGKEKT